MKWKRSSEKDWERNRTKREIQEFLRRRKKKKMMRMTKQFKQVPITDGAMRRGGEKMGAGKRTTLIRTNIILTWYFGAKEKSTFGSCQLLANHFTFGCSHLIKHFTTRSLGSRSGVLLAKQPGTLKSCGTAVKQKKTQMHDTLKLNEACPEMLRKC